MMLWSRKPFIALHILGRHGQYPTFSVCRPAHLFAATPQLAWTAVLQGALEREWELGEIAALCPEEVRLHAAISLSEPDTWNNGSPMLTLGASGSLDPTVVGHDLTASSTRSAVEDAIAKLDSSPLPHTGAQSYTVRDVGSEAATLEFLDLINTSDQLLFAGLARYLGGQRVAAVAGEHEEAALSLFASFGAALEFLRLYLAKRSARDASFEDVFAYVNTTFPEGAAVVDHLRELYELRLTATHPSNRMGEFWAPPLMADDFYSLRDTTAALYRHLLRGDCS